jgi:TatD DNase family protein
MYFDTHCHANFDDYDTDRAGIMQRAFDQDVWMTNVGTSFITSKSAVVLARKYDKGVYATIGIHPTHIENFNEDEFASLLSDKVMGVGEIGLDYFRVAPEDAEAKQLQKNKFAAQLAFAQKYSLPVVIHCRDAYDDTLGILKSYYTGPGILHSFTGDWDTAKKFLDLGFYIGLNGILMFDKTGKLNEVCQNVPNDKLLSETDAPYLTPPPHRGKRNEPAFVKYVVAHIAQIKWLEEEQMAQQLFDNACRIYNILDK